MSRARAAAAATELETLTTRVAWSQWRAIGGSAAARGAWTPIVDPEALVLVSLFLRDREPRLREVLASWVSENAPLLSVQRLKNLRSRYPSALHQRIAEFSQEARALSRHPRWQSLGDGDDDAERAPQLPAIPRATAPALHHAAALLLRLRTAMGVGLKADVLTLALGTDGVLTVREIADALAYTLVGSRAAATDLASAGFLVESRGKPSAFAVNYSEWASLLRLPERPRWFGWHHWFTLIVDLLTWIHDPPTRALSDYAFDVKLRQLFERHPLFFRSVAHQIGGQAFLTERGDSLDVLAALVAWVQEQHVQTLGA
ncbi:MAG: hypothetical protein MUF00_00475 [Gemmatimonadaceae bacterium]|nr:hypothetical protein [Gemmatimonadaceae bacterium]